MLRWFIAFVVFFSTPALARDITPADLEDFLIRNALLGNIDPARTAALVFDNTSGSASYRVSDYEGAGLTSTLPYGVLAVTTNLDPATINDGTITLDPGGGQDATNGHFDAFYIDPVTGTEEFLGRFSYVQSNRDATDASFFDALEEAREAIEERAAEDGLSLDEYQEVFLIENLTEMIEAMEVGELAASLDEEDFGTTETTVQESFRSVRAGIRNTLTQRFRAVRAGQGAGLSLMGQQYAMADGEWTLAAQLGDDQVVDNIVDRWGLFANASVSFSQLDGQPDAGTGASLDASGQTYTFTFGGDYRLPYLQRAPDGRTERFNDVVTVGAAISYAYSDFEGDNNYETDLHFVDGSAYLLFTPLNNVSLDTVVSAGYFGGDYIRNSFIDQDIHSMVHGVTLSLSSSLLYSVDLGNGFVASPKARIDLSQLHVNGYDEGGFRDTIASRTVDGYTIEDTRFAIGSDISRAFSADFGVVQPYAGVLYIRDMSDDTLVRSSNDGITFVTNRFAVEDRNYAEVSAGVTVVLASDWIGVLDYNGIVLNDDRMRHSLTVSASRRF